MNKDESIALAARTESYARKVKQLFDEAVEELLDIAKESRGKTFSFSETKKMERRTEQALRKLHSATTAAIRQGIKLEWDKADKATDKMLSNIFGKDAISNPRFSPMLSRNTDAMNAFLNRADNGMNLSQRIWKYTLQLKDEMEAAIAISIGEGESAQTIARRVKQYLLEPDKLFRRVRGADGKLHLSKAAKAYHPGQGVYRSSYKNAMRVARTETNMAYRTEDCNRLQQLDFVLGIRINLSKMHPEEDICDELKGDYPTDFLFMGWHPQCFCYMTSILPSDEELRKYNKALVKGQNYPLQGKIKAVPKAFSDWVASNKENIENAAERGKLPYFLRDNRKYWDENYREDTKPTIQDIAAARHAARTPEQEQAIRDAWNERNHKRDIIKKGASNVLGVAKKWAEIDYSSLESAIASGDYDKMKAASKFVSQSIVAMRNEENALKDFIPNVHDLHSSYSLQELKLAHQELDDVFGKWLKKYNYASIDAAPLDHLRNKLDFEKVNKNSYTNFDIVDKAIDAKIGEIQLKIEWNNLLTQVASIKKFKTKSSTFKAAIQRIDNAILNNDVNELRSSISEAENQRLRLMKANAKNKQGSGNALNPNYKGGAVGTDITATFDARTMKSLDPFRGTYTNNAARMQGFDSPAKLVSKQEFDSLVLISGDEFYRTVNPTTFNGKSMAGEEFASQMYLADNLELNGSGGRVYGDGIYVASSSWDGSKLNTLTDDLKKRAFRSSAVYGNGAHKTMRMTWTRPPRLIKESELKRMAKSFGTTEKLKYGDGGLNTYACALGYDGILCDGIIYVVIFNRSIIAVEQF